MDQSHSKTKTKTNPDHFRHSLLYLTVDREIFFCLCRFVVLCSCTRHITLTVYFLRLWIFFELGAISDSPSARATIMRPQVVALTTLLALVTSSKTTNSKSNTKGNLASFVAKKLLHPSNENCVDLLHQFLHHKASSLSVLNFLAELCMVSRDFSLHLTRHAKWIVSLTKCLTSCNGKDANCRETCSVLQILCCMVTNAENIPTE